MNQILQEEERKYHRGVGKIGRTHDILNELEQKMAGYHERKRTEEQLLMSQEEPPPPTKTRSTFKLFTRPQTANLQQMQTYELEESGKQRSRGEVGQLLQEVEAIEQLVRKKLALKEQRVAQLQRQIQLAGEQKVHLYKINCQLQIQLQNMTKQQGQEEKRTSLEEQELRCELKTLKQIYENKKKQSKRLRKDEELLKQALRQSQERRKNFHESELRVIRSHSRGQIKQKRQKTQEDEKYLRALVGELDKLRKMVRSKMKKSVSKGRIH